MSTPATTATTLPGLNCGQCGYRKCTDLQEGLGDRPDLIRRCIHLERKPASKTPVMLTTGQSASAPSSPISDEWIDSLGRPFDFILDKFPEEVGPREIIIPHNPMLTREMEIVPGDILIGRPLGMSCGCPVTHCGVATEVDRRTGVISWCVTGPLQPREKGFKDLGYYIAEAYEGLITDSRSEIKIGMRYFFKPRFCMLQWRHSGLVNFVNRCREGTQIRIEGLWIG